MMCIHRPLKINGYMFRDIVSGKKVKEATCKCGKVWMTDGGKWFGFKMELSEP